MNTKRCNHRVALALAFVLVLGTLAGCAHKGKGGIDTDLASTDLSTADDSGGIEVSTGEGLPDLDEEGLFFGPSALQPVYFDYDSAELRPDAIATLRDNAEKIKAKPGVIIQVAGHCDERGTQEYNLALGERRALSVREHLIRLGVSGDRMITISYGEEFPRVEGTGEAVWAKNRRCEFNEAQ